MTKNGTIQWEPKKVSVSDLRENEKNPKLITEKGKQRLHKSLSKFGLAGTIVVNKDLSIIDGHSRKRDLIEQNVQHVWVSVPDRQLTEKEYLEFNAIFDIAKAGEPDMMMIEETFDDEFIKDWDIGKKKKIVQFTVDDHSAEQKQWYINIRCESEDQCKQLYEQYVSEGLDVKIVT